MNQPLLKVDNLVKNFELRANSGIRKTKKIVQAVSDVSFSVDRGQTLGIVGESGSGKTTVGRCVLQLLDITSGTIEFDGKILGGLSFEEMRLIRRKMQIVFQDPFASLDPKMTVGASIAEPLVVQGVAGDHAEKVSRLLELVGLAADHAKRFPHEFAGGVNLFSDLQKRLGMSYVFIAHDLSVVRHIADRVAVMYLGKIVEIGDKKSIYEHPTHPYTKALLSAVPVPNPTTERSRSRIMLEGDVPSPVNPPTGCRFRTRCWKATDLCASSEPQLIVRPSGQLSACHFPE